MAYNPFPTSYQPYPSQPQNNPGIVWVQGEAGAKSYLMAPNTTALLMDSERDVFYIKTSDASGMPRPLRVFDYKERTTEEKAPDLSNLVTKDEFEKFKAEVMGYQKVNDNEQPF